MIRSRYTGKPYTPNPSQLKVHNSKARFRVLCAGRKWGKSTLASMELLRFMLMQPGCRCFWLVPTYKQLSPVSEKIREWWDPELIRRDFKLHTNYRYIELVNGSYVWLHSVEMEDTLRGFSMDFVVLEEAAQMKESVWSTIVRPALLDTAGKALMISTPRGLNWFHQEYLKGQNRSRYPDYESWRFSTYDNPHISRELIDNEFKHLPSDIFRQEIMAEFISGAGSVFRDNVRACFRGEVSEERFTISRYSDGVRILPKEKYQGHVLVGIDLARHESFTVFTALDASTGELVGFERFRELSFILQKDRLLHFLSYFPHRQIVIDSRGLGESFFEELRREGVEMQGIKLTNPLKEEIIHNLTLCLDERRITGPFIPELVEELEAYTYHISESGNIIYEAPQNYTDDAVMSLAFAASLMRRKATDWVSIRGKGFLSKGEEA